MPIPILPLMWPRQAIQLRYVVLALAAASPPAVAPALAQGPGDPAPRVRDVIAAWHEAEERLDAAAARTLLTADYFHVTSTGQVLDTADLLRDRQALRERGVTRRYDRGPITVRVYSDAAVAHYPYEYRDGGSPLEGRYRNTLTLVEQGGTWRIASSHSSRLDSLAFVGVVELNRWPVVPLTAEQRAFYVGSYDADGEVVRIWEDDGQLRITPGKDSPLDPIFLVPMGSGVFAQGHFEDGEFRRIYWPGIRIRFVVEGGRVARYELVEDGRVLETGVRGNR